MGWGGGYVQDSTTGNYNIVLILFFIFFIFLFTDYTVIVSVNITGDTSTQRRVQLLFESFSTNMLTHTSEDLAGGSDNIVYS